MINPAPHVPSAILIGAGGQLRPLAPWPPHRDPPRPPITVPLGTPRRASPRWAALVRHGAGVWALYRLPSSPLPAALVSQGPVLGLRPSRGRWRDEGSVSIAVFPYYALVSRHPQRPRVAVADVGVKMGGEGHAAHSSFSSGGPVTLELVEPLPLRTGFGWVISWGLGGLSEFGGSGGSSSERCGLSLGPVPGGKGWQLPVWSRGRVRFAFSPPL